MNGRIHVFAICDLPGIARMVDLIKIAFIQIDRIQSKLILLINEQGSRIFHRSALIFLHSHRKKLLLPSCLETDLGQRIVLIDGSDPDIAVIPVSGDQLVLIDAAITQPRDIFPVISIFGTGDLQIMEP